MVGCWSSDHVERLEKQLITHLPGLRLCMQHAGACAGQVYAAMHADHVRHPMQGEPLTDAELQQVDDLRAAPPVQHWNTRAARSAAVSAHGPRGRQDMTSLLVAGTDELFSI